jgi:hypothetical protein
MCKEGECKKDVQRGLWRFKKTTRKGECKRDIVEFGGVSREESCSTTETKLRIRKGVKLRYIGFNRQHKGEGRKKNGQTGDGEEKRGLWQGEKSKTCIPFVCMLYFISSCLHHTKRVQI